MVCPQCGLNKKIDAFARVQKNHIKYRREICTPCFEAERKRKIQLKKEADEIVEIMKAEKLKKKLPRAEPKMKFENPIFRFYNTLLAPGYCTHGLGRMRPERTP